MDRGCLSFQNFTERKGSLLNAQTYLTFAQNSVNQTGNTSSSSVVSMPNSHMVQLGSVCVLNFPMQVVLTT